MLDYKPNQEPAPPVESSLAEAREFNTSAHLHGIFYTINEYTGARKKSNITKIKACFCDFDIGTKAEQVAALQRGPIPSFINETKRGHQAAWFLSDGSRATWYPLMRDRIIPFFNGDRNACDPVRLLRAPDSTHWKDPQNPFNVKALWYKPKVIYSTKYLLSFFPDANAESKTAYKQDFRERESIQSSDFWEALYYFDHEEILTRLSGHEAVNNEIFTFKRVSRGKLNIFANGKGTPCFVDAEGRIGVGGPTIFQFLKWDGYRNSSKDALAVMRELIPELPWTTMDTLKK